MNNISETQLEPKQLRRLAAQKQLYSDAKFVQKIQAGLNVFAPLILMVLVKYLSMKPVYAAGCGIIVTFLNILWFSPRRQYLKKIAAGIQELFDCDVLELDWNELKSGSRLEKEKVEKYALKYKRKNHDYADLENWYPKDIGKLPLILGRIACQRENCTWDVQLRQRYLKLVIGVLVILTVLGFYFGIEADFSIEIFILFVMVPLTPAYVLGIQQYKDHTASIRRLDELRQYSEWLWEEALKVTDPIELTRSSRGLQDLIYDHRTKNSLILDGFYNIFKNEDEELMNRTASELVNEALQTLEK